MGVKIVRTIGIARARFKIGMMNLGYNIPAWFSSGGWRLRPLACVQGGVCVARAEGTARSPASRQIGPRSSLTLARAKQTLAQLRRNRRKQVLFEVPKKF